jgi:hypothetical protein
MTATSPSRCASEVFAAWWWTRRSSTGAGERARARGPPWRRRGISTSAGSSGAIRREVGASAPQRRAGDR